MGHIAQPSKVKFCIIFYIFTFFPFQYYISHSRLQDLMLIVAAWHHSKFGRNFCIGQTTIQLKDFCFGEPFQRWYKLEHSEQRGRNLSSMFHDDVNSGTVRHGSYCIFLAFHNNYYQKSIQKYSYKDEMVKTVIL